MRLSVSLTAFGACCLLAISALTAQVPSATKGAAREPTTSRPGAGSEKSPTTTEPGVTILTTFPGDTGPGPKDAPDNSGAVGPNHVVDFTNANVVIHDKAAVSDLGNNSLPSLQ
jgi:hypothetical protein